MILSLMSQDYIESYLDMIEKYEPADYGIGMADFNDIKTVTKGSLIKYIKISLNRLSNLSNVLESIYPNTESVIMTPVKKVSHRNNYVEVFVFKK
ncbi:hypothetical protein GCM10008908_34660 [Clostridium subterminale]|uniref:Uncharacterized protein n=2 Tax=Clostridium subterminale TaxID=1550 RepID=A0ABP3W773_CLOSU